MHRKNGSDKAFYFKQFQVYHDRCGMKVGTDGVLLGAWANTDKAMRILDIGTGSGLIALMLAQRSDGDSKIDAVEINIEAFKQAQNNILNSPWPDKISLCHSSIQDFETNSGYDLIVCNPPYFANSLLPINMNRAQSRHAADLTFQDLISTVKHLIHPKGIFCIVLPSNEAAQFIKLAGKANLFATLKLYVKTKQLKLSKRILLEFANQSSSQKEGELIIQKENGEWTDSYIDLVSPFYLWAERRLTTNYQLE